MPVSRKRKKSRKSRKPTRAASLPQAPAAGGMFAQLAAEGDRVRASRDAVAVEAAGSLVTDLARSAPDRSDCDLEDELCTRIGAGLAEWDDGPLDEHVDPPRFAEAIFDAAAAAVHAAVSEPNTGPDGWRAPWRVLAAVARVFPYPYSEATSDVIRDLRAGPGGGVLPRTIEAPAIRSEVLWTRDGYGSRFGVTAAFSMPDGPDRWYLWDVDACGYKVVTVHAAYYPSQEQVLAAWLAGVGPDAAGEPVLTPVDDWSLLIDLLPAEEGFLRVGGEDAALFAEYHRSKRLAELATAAVRSTARPAEEVTREDVAATAAAEFAAWLPGHRSDPPDAADLKERAAELADSWSFDAPVRRYHTCSPHRVALNVLHLRNYYEDEFAAELLDLLPDWVSWLATCNGTAPELVERCRPYTRGDVHPELGSDDNPNWLLRVTE